MPSRKSTPFHSLSLRVVTTPAFLLYSAYPELSDSLLRIPNTATCIRIPAKLVVMQAVLSQSADYNPEATRGHAWANWIGAAVLAFLPLVIRSFSWGRGTGAAAHVEMDTTLWVIVIAAAIYQFPIASNFLAPALFAAFLDFYRRFVWLQFCGDIISEGAVREVRHGAEHNPTSEQIKPSFGFRVPMDVAENAYGWVRTRQWLYETGWEFHLRVRVYFTAIFAVLIVLAASLIVQIFTQLSAGMFIAAGCFALAILLTLLVGGLCM